MEVNLGYKQTVTGVIPKDWEVAAISDVADRVTVGFVGSMAHLFTRQGVPLLRGQNVLPNKLDLTDTRFISTDTHSQWKKSALQPGDVVMVRVGYPGTSCVIPEGLGEANAASLVVVRPTAKKLFAPFLSWVLNSDFGKRQIDSYLVGGAQQVLNTTTAAIFKLPLPSRAEQEAIAEALSDVDALIESLEQLLAKKRQLKQGAMQELLTGKKRLPGFEVTPGYKRTEVGVIPKDWEVVRLSELVAAGPKNGYSGRSRKDAQGTPTLALTATTYGVLVLSQETVKRLDETIDPRSDIFLQTGDVLVQRSNTLELVGTTAVFDGPSSLYVYPDLMMRLRFKVFDTALWFWRYANSSGGRSYFVSVAAGSTGSMPKISGEVLRNMLLPLPPPAEQRAIASVLSDMDAEIAALEAKLAKARQVKQGMMQELLTGRIRLV